VAYQQTCPTAGAFASVKDLGISPLSEDGSESALRCEPDAPWKDDTALEVLVDVEHSPIVVWLAGTLNQAASVNVVPVVKELIADGGRDFELHTPALVVSDAGGTAALVELQGLVQRLGGRFTCDGQRLRVVRP